jgi:hypothetical protein
MERDRLRRFERLAVDEEEGRAHEAPVEPDGGARVTGGVWSTSRRFDAHLESPQQKLERRQREIEARRAARSQRADPTMTAHRARVRRAAKRRAQRLAETLPEWALERMKPMSSSLRRTRRGDAGRPSTSSSASRRHLQQRQRAGAASGSRSRGRSGSGSRSGSRSRASSAASHHRFEASTRQRSPSPPRRAARTTGVYTAGPRTFSALPPTPQRAASRARTFELTRGLSTRAPSRMHRSARPSTAGAATPTMLGTAPYRGARYSPHTHARHTTRTTVFTHEPGTPVPQRLNSRSGLPVVSHEGMMSPLRRGR